METAHTIKSLLDNVIEHWLDGLAGPLWARGVAPLSIYNPRRGRWVTVPPRGRR